MLALNSGASKNAEQLFGWLSCKYTITKFARMLLFCSIQAAEFEVPDLLLPSQSWDPRNEGCLLANEEDLIPLSCKIKASISERALLKIYEDCEADPVAALLTFA